MFLSGFEWFLSVSECSLSGLVRFWVVLVGLVLVLSVLEWFLSVSEIFLSGLVRFWVVLVGSVLVLSGFLVPALESSFSMWLVVT